MANAASLDEEMEKLKGMVQARVLPGSIFDRAMPPGSCAQQRGVVVKLRCCKKSIDQKCNDLNDGRACATQADAARLLRAKIEKSHSSDDCLQKAHQSLANELGAASSSQPASAFDLMRREPTLQSARTELARALQRVAKAAEVEAAAIREHIDAKLAEEEVRSTLHCVYPHCMTEAEGMCVLLLCVRHEKRCGFWTRSVKELPSPSHLRVSFLSVHRILRTTATVH